MAVQRSVAAWPWAKESHGVNVEVGSATGELTYRSVHNVKDGSNERRLLYIASPD